MPEPSSNGDGHAESKKLSTASIIVKLVMDAGVRLFHSPDERCYAHVPSGDHMELWPLKSARFRSWLSRAYYRNVGKTPGSQALTDALAVMEGIALHESKAEPTYIRVAGHNGKIYLDL